jgi:hypothetical protein
MSRRSTFPELSLSLLTVITLAVGCTRLSYEIDMELNADGTVERKLLLEAADPEATGDLLAEQRRLTQLLGTPPQNDAAAEGFAEWTGRYQGILPADFGGAGRVWRHQTSLGELIIYQERFRGNYDLKSELETRLASLSRLGELLGEWAAAQAGSEQSGQVFREFFQQELVADLQNLLLMGIISGVDTGRQPSYSEQAERLEASSREFRSRAFHYLWEKQYLVNGVIVPHNRWNEQPDEVIAWIRQVLHNKLGQQLDSPVEVALPPLQNAETLDRSLQEFLSRTPEFEELNAEEQEDAMNVLVRLVRRALGDPYRSRDSATVRFKHPSPPLETNGRWDEAERAVTWELHAEIPGETPFPLLPAFAYALWSVPDEKRQQEYFGRVLLTGLELRLYVEWRNSLTVDEGVDWDLFLLSLQPGDDLRSRITEFRFTSRESSDEIKSTLESDLRIIFEQAWKKTALPKGAAP